MTQYDNELRGSLFKNDKDGNEARPDYTGTCQIGGVEYRMAAWLKEAASGKKYMEYSDLAQSLTAEAEGLELNRTARAAADKTPRSCSCPGGG